MILRFRNRIPETKSDAELLSDFGTSGDPETLGVLYSRYMHLVYGVSLKYLEDREEAMDAVMQIFENLIHDIPGQKIINFRSWLYVVTKNHCLMRLRSQKSINNKIRKLIADSEEFVKNGYDLHPIDNDENVPEVALADCIEKLKNDQKACIRQFYFENKCYSEIAENLGMNAKEVKSHLQNGKRNLKLCLEKKNEKEI